MNTVSTRSDGIPPAGDNAGHGEGAPQDLRRQRLALALRGGPVGPARRLAMTSTVERALGRAWVEAAGDEPPPGVCLAVVGSVARGETGPASDIDLVLVHDGRRPAAEIAGLADRLWYPLWDSGSRIDHSVRTPAQCREVAAADTSAGIGLLDLRPIAGDPDIAIRTRAQLLADWRAGIRRRLPDLLDVLSERLERFGEITNRLEPDLKEARGGLRDITVLRALAASWATDRPHGEVDLAHERLLDVRDALHTVTGRGVDRLLLADQDAVAVAAGVNDADELLIQVAQAGRTVAQAVDITIRHARQSMPSRRLGIRRGRRRPLLRPLGGGVVEHEGEVVLGSGVRPGADPMLALVTAARAVRAGLPISPVTVEHLAAESPPLPDPWPDGAREAFVDLLGGGEGLIQVWESLDLAGITSAWIPEWVAVRNRPQRNAIHRHTVDRHLIQTVVEASRQLRNVGRADLLLVTALLHDIGKLPGVQDHSLTGATMAARIARRMGFVDADVEIVHRLVGEHLTLAELATRRDPDDPRTVAALVEAVDGRDDVLDLLRALTESDATAAGPVAWTPWRAQLVDDLVRRARSALQGQPPPNPAPITDDEARLVRAAVADHRPHVAVNRFHELHVVSIVAGDRSGLLADIAGTLAAFRLAVKSALVRTVQVDGVGIAVDTWYVDAGPASVPQSATLETELRRLGDGDRSGLDVLARRDSGYRLPAGTSAEPRVILLPAASQDVTVLEVRAPDRPGLLHALGAALARLGADLRSAHVATYGGQAVDVLYVSEPGGSPLSPGRVAAVISALVDAAELPSA